MTGLLARAPRLLTALVIVVLGCSLAACSDSEEEPSAGASSKPTATASSSPSVGYPFDTSDEGDDLLVDKRSSSTFGGNAPTSWRFPSFYADGTTDETSTTTEVGGVTFGLLAVASTGSTSRAKAEEFATRVRVGEEGVHEVNIGGRDWVAVVDEGTGLSRVVLLGDFPGGVTAGASFTADVPLADVPPERVAELHQMVQSIEAGTASG